MACHFSRLQPAPLDRTRLPPFVFSHHLAVLVTTNLQQTSRDSCPHTTAHATHDDFSSLGNLVRSTCLSNLYYWFPNPISAPCIQDAEAFYRNTLDTVRRLSSLPEHMTQATIVHVEGTSVPVLVALTRSLSIVLVHDGYTHATLVAPYIAVITSPVSTPGMLCHIQP